MVKRVKVVEWQCDLLFYGLTLFFQDFLLMCIKSAMLVLKHGHHEHECLILNI